MLIIIGPTSGSTRLLCLCILLHGCVLILCCFCFLAVFVDDIGDAEDGLRFSLSSSSSSSSSSSLTASRLRFFFFLSAACVSFSAFFSAAAIFFADAISSFSFFSFSAARITSNTTPVSSSPHLVLTCC